MASLHTWALSFQSTQHTFVGRPREQWPLTRVIGHDVGQYCWNKYFMFNWAENVRARAMFVCLRKSPFWYCVLLVAPLSFLLYAWTEMVALTTSKAPLLWRHNNENLQLIIVHLLVHPLLFYLIYQFLKSKLRDSWYDKIQAWNFMSSSEYIGKIHTMRTQGKVEPVQSLGSILDQHRAY